MLLILALVAFFAQLFMPLIHISLTVPKGSMDNVVSFLITGDSNASGSTSGVTCNEVHAGVEDEDGNANAAYNAAYYYVGGTTAVSTAVSDSEKLILYFEYMPEFNIDISFNPMTLVSVFSNELDENALADYIATLFPSGEEIFEQAGGLLSPLVAGIVSTELLVSMNDGMEARDLYNVQMDTEDTLVSVLTNLAEGNTATARTEFSTYLNDISGALSFEITDEDMDSYMGFFDDIVAAGTQAGTFSMMNLVNGVLDYIEDDEELGIDSDIMEIIRGLVNDPGETIGQYAVKVLDATGIADAINATTENLRNISIVLFVLLCVFPAALWLILAIAAFRHLFARNKKVGMWYVKLVSIWSCILFFILPCVALAVIPGMIGEEALFASMSIVITGSGIVTGICYLLMWAVSIFMCHPTKKKLKKLMKEIKYYR